MENELPRWDKKNVDHAPAAWGDINSAYLVSKLSRYILLLVKFI